MYERIGNGVSNFVCFHPGVLSSGLDSSLRGVDDALLSLTTVSNLEKDAIAGLVEEGRLLRETDCLIASLVRAQEQRRADFVVNLGKIEQRASQITGALPGRCDKICTAINNAYETMRSALAEHLVNEITLLKSEAVRDLDNLLGSFGTAKFSAENLQQKVEEELNGLRSDSYPMVRRWAV